MESQVFFNKLYILASSSNDDIPSGQVLYDDLKYYSWKNPRFSIELIQVNTKTNFFESLHIIENSILENNFLPYLHIDIHGAEDKTGLVLSSGELIKWDELYKPFQSINIKCKNNLFVSMATCHGAHMIRLYNKFSEPCPFYAFIGSPYKLREREILNGYSEYFQALMQTKHFGPALKALCNSNPMYHDDFNYMSCEIFFDKIIDNVQKGYIDPKRRRLIAKNLAYNWKNKYPHQGISNNELVKRMEREIITKSGPTFSEWKDIFCMKKYAR